MGSQLECTICSESFKNPKMLPCGHSFCEECLERWLKTSTRKPQQHPRTLNKLSCPECRDEHPLPAQGVIGFKKNFALARAADDTPKCQNCETGRVAIAKCLDCDGWLCDKCCNLHKQGLTKKHEVISIHEVIVRKSEDTFGLPQYKSCSRHNNKLIEYFCIKCKVACCQSGSLTEHKHHDCVTLDERISDIGKEIQEMLKAFLQVSFKTNKFEESWENGMKYKKPNTNEVSDQIIKLEKHLVEVIKKCAKKLLDEVQIDDKEFIKSYQKAKQDMNNVKKHIASSESEVKGWLKRRIPQEMYSREKAMKQKLDQTAVIRELPQPVWNMFTLDQPQVDIETEISKLFGTLKKTVKYAEPIKHGKPTLVRTINVRTPGDRNECRLWGAAFLNDGNIAVSDHSLGNAKIKVFTPDGKLVLQSKKGVFRSPFDVSQLPGDRDQLLVIDGKKKKVLKWNMRNQEVREFVTLGGKDLTHPHGIITTKLKNQDIVLIGDWGASAVFHVNRNGHVLQQVKIDDVIGNSIWYIAGHPEYQEIIVCNCDKGIFAIRNGKTLWCIDKKLPNPRGIFLTGTGEVLVADGYSHRVSLVSREGQIVDTLLSPDDGLNQPMGLAYCEQHHLLAVVEWKSQLLKLYQY